jgi:DNA-binding transcriptional ArsR family regulator
LILRHQKSNFGRLAPEIPLSLAFVEEDGVMLEVRLQYGGQAVQANAELFGRRGEVVRYLSENGEATAKAISEGTEVPLKTLYRLLKQLEGDSLIEEVPDTFPKRYRLRGDFLTFSPPIKAEKVRNCESGDSADTAAPPAAPPEPTPYDPRSESFEEWLARADTVLDHFCPSFQARAELTWDTIDDWLQQASMPHDPLGLEPHEVDALRVLLAFAEARGFPPLTIPEWNYTIRAGQEGWLNAMLDIAGTPAVAVATRLLQSLDAAGSPDAPAPTPINGNAGLTPLQFTLIQEV